MGGHDTRAQPGVHCAVGGVGHGLSGWVQARLRVAVGVTVLPQIRNLPVAPGAQSAGQPGGPTVPHAQTRTTPAATLSGLVPRTSRPRRRAAASRGGALVALRHHRRLPCRERTPARVRLRRRGTAAPAIEIQRRRRRSRPYSAQGKAADRRKPSVRRARCAGAARPGGTGAARRAHRRQRRAGAGRTAVGPAACRCASSAATPGPTACGRSSTRWKTRSA